jgi:predicted molibdopterin-dependent oxidoreductase YjgC
VEAVLKSLQGSVSTFDKVLADAGNHRIKALYITGGYPTADWLTAEQSDTLKSIHLIVAHELFPSALARASAKYLLPATSFAEREGVFVNYKGLAQSLHRACRPPQDSRTEAQVFCDLLERRGLVQMAGIRQEMASEIRAFSSLTTQPFPAEGVKLID